MCHTPAFDMRSNSRLLVCMWPNGPLTLLCVETLLTRIAEHAAPSALDGNEVQRETSPYSYDTMIFWRGIR